MPKDKKKHAIFYWAEYTQPTNRTHRNTVQWHHVKVKKCPTEYLHYSQNMIVICCSDSLIFWILPVTTAGITCQDRPLHINDQMSMMFKYAAFATWQV